MIARILVAEDDAHIRQGLVATLESEGYGVTAAVDGVQALRLFGQEKFDLVLLDIMMPKVSGYDVCRDLRARGSRIPVLFLTAKSQEVDIVVGLKLGADDYLAKPFGMHELLARVEALIRRSRLAASTETSLLPDVFRFGSATINRSQFSVTIDGKASALTARELRLAETFASHPWQVMTRDALLNAVWGINYFGTTRTLDQHVAQLRRKVDSPSPTPSAIATVHGVGYRHDPGTG